jgi:hypothetical protein
MKYDRKIENIVNHSEVSEKEIEKYLIRRSKELGLLCLKYTNPSLIGFPDRIILLPSGRLIWVELKSKGKKPSAIQLARFSEMKRKGHEVKIIDSKMGIDSLMNNLEAKGFLK